MDVVEHDSLTEYREAAGRWVERYIPEEWVTREHRSGTHHNAELHRLLAEQGLLGAGWPREYGGTDVDPRLTTAVIQAIGGRGMRLDGWITTEMVARTVLAVGSEDVKAAVVPAVLRGEMVIVLGYTEPGSGSDAAAAATRAVREGAGWVVDGAKMFTSTAHVATHVFLLTRTDPDVPKHRGLTMLLARLDDPGVQIQPIHTLGGQRTNATFYSGVRVPDGMRIGEVDRGWDVMRVALAYERGVEPERSGPSLVQRAADWARSTPDHDGASLLADGAVAETLVRIAIDDEVGRLLTARVRWLTANGQLPGVEGSMAKLFTSESHQRRALALVDLLGADAVRSGPHAPLGGRVEEAFRDSPVGTIYGGTSEVIRDVVAERRLGLPRSRPTG